MKGRIIISDSSYIFLYIILFKI
ncbi:sortase B protein-sorting domain-containing protein [Patescibacteria group bacterium]